MWTRERFPSLHNKWQSVLGSAIMWPGEYQNAADACGNPHKPWGVNPNYFECCTGTPFADDARASVFLASYTSPVKIANILGRVAPLRGKTLQVQVGSVN